MSGKRQIFIGDVQGCYQEFLDLLDRLNYEKESDELYLTGDLINRGPQSAEMLDFMIANPEVRSVLGNHEYYFLEEQAGHRPKRKKTHFKSLREQLSGNIRKYTQYLRQLPGWIETPDWLLIHGGLLPGKRPDQMRLEDLVSLRMVQTDKGEEPWFDLYREDKLVIFGHWAKLGLLSSGRARALDSGCVYGGSLSALVLPGDRFISVPARKQYYDPVADRET